MTSGDDNTGLPEGCPPETAIPASGSFFRLVKRSLQIDEVPGPDDWILPHAKRNGDCVGQTERCECHAHSLMSDLNEIRRTSDVVPWVRRKAVARVDLEPGMGRILAWPTPVFATHYEWWPTPASLVPDAVVVEAAAA